MAACIPVVDFSCLSIDISDDNLDREWIQKVGDDLIRVFSSVGFVYLKNVGISRTLIDNVNAAGEDFFHLPNAVKSCYKFELSTNHGWVNMEKESADISKPCDLKECLNITMAGIQAQKLPCEVKDFPRMLESLFDLCAQLTRRVLYALTVGLHLQDQEALTGCHNPAAKKQPSFTTMRLLHYPPILTEVKPGQIRLGEHTDCGSLTLLFQDDIGGLQVFTRDGQWVEATPIPDTVLVNIADLLQRWTSDRLVSTPHRVLIPADETLKRTKRQSIAFFVQPDKGSVIRCLDGSDKYAPILADEFLSNRLKQTHHYHDY